MSEILTTALPEHLQARLTAKRRQLSVQLVAAAVALLCFVGAGLLLPGINAIRKEHQLLIDPDSTKGLPPGIALLSKLGTFRALAIDWASIRAERLKEEGKTYEALQLHMMVCNLAPRFPKVWVNAAWNMAYNISVSQYSPEARWQWVRNGLLILRDEGLRHNPRSVTLFRELAWIYWHKIGDILDDEHLNYKRALAVEMERILGAQPVTLSSDEYYAWFRKIVAAPRDLNALLREDAEVAAVASRLRDLKLELDENLLDFVARHIRPELQVESLLQEKKEDDPLFVQRMQLLTGPTTAPAVDRLLAALRSKVLRERYKFDIDWMLDLMEKQFGPLDWRNAVAHTLYWSTKGSAAAEGIESTNHADNVNNDRLTFFALQSLIMRGRIALWPDFEDPFLSYLDLTPDTRFIPVLYDTSMRLGKKHFGDDPRFVEGTPGPNYMTGFVTNMENWIQLLYLEGGDENTERAENYYAWLREYNKHPDGSTQSRYEQTLDEFVMGDILNQLDTHRAATGLLRSFIVRGLKHLGLGQTRQGLASIKRAAWAHDYWMRDSSVEINDRRKLQPIETILRDQIVDFFKQPEVDPLFKARLWRELPLEQRQQTYDVLAVYFTELAASRKPPWNVAAAFGEPPGMEEARQRQPETIGAPRSKDVDQGERYKP